MNTIILTLKGILMYSALTLTMFVIMGIDSMVQEGIIFAFAVLLFFMYYLCFIFLTKEDIEILTLHKYFK